MAVGEVIEDFAGQTTAHGLGRIVAPGWIGLRIFWGLMVILALAICSWQISLLFIKYYSYPLDEDINVSARLYLRTTRFHYRIINSITDQSKKSS